MQIGGNTQKVSASPSREQLAIPSIGVGILLVIGIYMLLDGVLRPEDGYDLLQIVLGVAAVIFGIVYFLMLAIRPPSLLSKSPSGRKGDEGTKEWRFDKHRFS